MREKLLLGITLVILKLLIKVFDPYYNLRQNRTQIWGDFGGYFSFWFLLFVFFKTPRSRSELCCRTAEESGILSSLIKDRSFLGRTISCPEKRLGKPGPWKNGSQIAEGAKAVMKTAPAENVGDTARLSHPKEGEATVHLTSDGSVTRLRRKAPETSASHSTAIAAAMVLSQQPPRWLAGHGASCSVI